METIKLTVREREATGDGPARRLRAEGRIPGVTYGKGLPGTAISVDLAELRAALAHGQNVILELDFETAGKTTKKKTTKSAKAKQSARYAVVKSIQTHPSRRQVLHIDLHEVDLAEEIEAPVPIELVGTAAGVLDGGVLGWEHREVVVRALPGDVPSSLSIDISEILVGQHLTVDALSAPDGVTILDAPETIVVAVLAPRIEVAAPEEEEVEEVEGVEEAPLEPEVIGEVESEE